MAGGAERTKHPHNRGPYLLTCQPLHIATWSSLVLYPPTPPHPTPPHHTHPPTHTLSNIWSSSCTWMSFAAAVYRPGGVVALPPLQRSKWKPHSWFTASELQGRGCPCTCQHTSVLPSHPALPQFQSHW